MSPLIEYQERAHSGQSPFEVIGDFPDKSGEYKTTKGDLKIDFSNLSTDREVILEGDFLKGKQRKSGGPEFGPTTRKCQISKKTNSGSTMLDSDTILKITLKDSK